MLSKLVRKSTKTRKNSIVAVCSSLLSYKSPSFPSSLSSSSFSSPSDQLPELENVRKVLEEKKIATEIGHSCLSFVCPGFQKGKSLTRGVDDGSKVFVNAHTGAFVCNSCLQSGDFQQFQNLITTMSSKPASKSHLTCRELWSQTDDFDPNVDLFKDCKKIAELNGDEFEKMCQNLKIFNNGKNNLEQTSFASYDCYVTYPNLGALAFPYHGPSSVVDNRLRGVRRSDSRMKMRVPNQLHGLFGWNLLTKRTTEVILTANELDALAIYQVWLFQFFFLTSPICY